MRQENLAKLQQIKLHFDNYNMPKMTKSIDAYDVHEFHLDFLVFLQLDLPLDEAKDLYTGIVTSYHWHKNEEVL